MSCYVALKIYVFLMVNFVNIKTEEFELTEFGPNEEEHREKQ